MGVMKQRPLHAFLEEGLRRIAIAVVMGLVGVCAHPVSSHAQTIKVGWPEGPPPG